MNPTIPTITLTLTAPAYNAVVMALAKRPYDEVADLIADVNRQVSEQINPAATPAPADVANANTAGAPA